jgi:hypothetical protein
VAFLLNLTSVVTVLHVTVVDGVHNMTEYNLELLSGLKLNPLLVLLESYLIILHQVIFYMELVPLHMRSLRLPIR